jgi:hypothetical protein
MGLPINWSNCTRLPLLVAMAILCGSIHGCRTLNAKPSGRMQDITAVSQPQTNGEPSTIEVLHWVVVKPSSTASGLTHLEAPQGVFAWDVELKTASEIWCERRCSEFTVDDSEISGVRSLKAIKVSTLGNTTPGMLNVQRKITGDRSKITKVTLQNVGIMGQTITIEDVIDRDHPNFYAVPMMLGKHPSGTRALLQGEFDGRVIDIRHAPADVEATVSRSAVAQQGFVMGSLITTKNADGKEMSLFDAVKIIMPWSGD